MQRTAKVLLTVVVLMLTAAGSRAADDGFKPIFDGKTLDGWKAPLMQYWSVVDGSIVGATEADKPLEHNQFIVWQGGPVDDFELKLKFRITGTIKANSGIQYRGVLRESDGHVVGYQADIDRAGQWMGALYDEATPRKVLAKRGQKTVIDEKGEKHTQDVADAAALWKNVDIDGWNEYHIIAHGGHLIHKINGKTTIEVIDNDPAGLDLSGVLALQLHSGPPMKIEFKDIMLKRLPMADGRKKVVMIAGHPSHPCGAHEFNAGIAMLGKRLAKVPGLVVAEYHDKGWPQDPTAFDNADAIVLYMDGGGKHPVSQHLEQVDKLMKQGVGLMCMHYAVHVDAGKPGDYFKKWIGGYYESDWSINPMWDADLRANKNHPITRGVDPAKIHDEWYYCMRFRDNMQGVTSILEATPDDEARSGSTSWPRGPKKHIVEASGRSETLMWAVQRPDGGRGVGFTGGHFHHNWAYDTQRKVVLNAMAWVAGAEVPAGGIDSEPVSEDELNANLDAKKNMKRLALPDSN
ncbi:DUF1080 domain-containing protein [Planctomycetales bacterium ZRK34]|nr:DUF1080 domain-containing protein [Planctomycetales bacterium ZRK34]